MDMSLSARFGSVLTAMVTPFDDELGLDVAGAVHLARWLVDHGSHGLVVAGTTGESPVLTRDELAELWRAVSEAVTVPVLAGTGSNDTDHAISSTRL
ncbi:MAG: dihydrodipicolinate synthase family protein, partial [Acidimicrobiales bacterium]